MHHQVLFIALNTHSGSTASCSHADDTRIRFSLIFFFHLWVKLLPLNNQGSLAAHNYLAKYYWSESCQHDYFTAPL